MGSRVVLGGCRFSRFIAGACRLVGNGGNFLKVPSPPRFPVALRSEEHTSELQSRENLVCRLLLEKKKKQTIEQHASTRHTGKQPCHVVQDRVMHETQFHR